MKGILPYGYMHVRQALDPGPELHAMDAIPKIDSAVLLVYRSRRGIVAKTMHFSALLVVADFIGLETNACPVHAVDTRPQEPQGMVMMDCTLAQPRQLCWTLAIMLAGVCDGSYW